MNRDGVTSRNPEMKCPKCGKFALRTNEHGVGCKVCGYELSPGEVDRFRLFQLLRDEEKMAR